MKKISKLLLLFLIIPLKVGATSLSVGLSCPSSAKAGATVSCTISGNVSGGSLTGLTAKFSYTNGLSFVSFSQGSGWSNYYSSSSGFSIGNVNGKSGSTTFGTLKVQIPSTASINSTYTVAINSLDGSDASGNSLVAGGKSATIKVLSGNNNLSSLSLSNGTINFSSSTTSYSLTINSSTTLVSAVLADQSASFVSGYGSRTLNLSYGTHAYYIKVKAANGDIKTYTLNITRPDNRSSDNKLKDLSLSEGTISFEPSVMEYDISVKENVSSIKITGTLNNSKASFVSGYGNRTVDLKYGNNIVLVKVKAENGSERTYKINVFRNDGRDDNNYINSLEVVGYNIRFKKEKLEYTLKVPYDLEKLEINITLDSEKSKYEINGNNLSIGENEVSVIVTAENEQKRIYKIKVTKLNEGELLPSAYANNIHIKGYDIDFSKDKYSYSVEVKDSNPLNIKVELENPDSIYRIIGNKNLNNEDEITIIIISTDLEVKEYVIKIVKNKSIIPVIIIITIVTIISILLIILLGRKLIKGKKISKTSKEKNIDIHDKEKVTVKVEETRKETPVTIEKNNISFLDETEEDELNPSKKVLVENKNTSFLDD